MQDSGWTFFYLADTISAISINFNTAQAGQDAMKRLIAKAAARHCNALQVDRIAAHFFLGIPYLRVSAHPRHIQRGMVSLALTRRAKLAAGVVTLRGSAASGKRNEGAKASVEPLRKLARRPIRRR
ncbi:MAG: hypothetical protein IPJ98_28590 [Bryobacterales bacterium]|nr:hypothetical protein [Bryobacterales bacterium]